MCVCVRAYFIADFFAPEARESVGKVIEALSLALASLRGRVQKGEEERSEENREYFFFRLFGGRERVDWFGR